MSEAFEIRVSTPADRPAIEALYGDAFPHEDLVPLLRDLLTLEHNVVSLIGTVGPSVVAHVVFTHGKVDLDGAHVALLGPLAIATAWQRKGFGTHLIEQGLEHLKQSDVTQVFVLGDRAYYQRFGFSTEVYVAPPYRLPREWESAWQSIRLGNAMTCSGGMICLPRVWLRRELWLP